MFENISLFFQAKWCQEQQVSIVPMVFLSHGWFWQQDIFVPNIYSPCRKHHWKARRSNMKKDYSTFLTNSISLFSTSKFYLEMNASAMGYGVIFLHSRHETLLVHTKNFGRTFMKFPPFPPFIVATISDYEVTIMKQVSSLQYTHQKENFLKRN